MSKHNKRCEDAKHDKCNCRCKGQLHKTRKLIKGKWQKIPLIVQQEQKGLNRTIVEEPSLDSWLIA